MKRNIFYATAIVALLAGCSANENLDNLSESNVYTISAGMNESPVSKVEYTGNGAATEGFTVNWQTTDALTLYTASGSTGTFNGAAVDQADKHKATFSGTFSPAISGTTDIYAYVNQEKVTMDASSVSTDLSSQDGTMADAVKHNILYASQADFNTASSTLSLSFAHKMSFLKLVLTFPAGTTGTATGITLRGTGLYRSVAFTTSTCTLASSAEGTITVPSATITDNKATVYVCIYPGSLSNVTATATVGTKAYTFDIQGTTAKPLAAGYTYTVARTNSSEVDMSATATTFAGGTGTADAPYLISNLAELKYFSSLISGNAYSGKYFKLTNDIYIGDGSVEWAPIGSVSTKPFGGIFDGDGHTISGKIKITASTVTAAEGYGLFGVMNNATIKNLKNAASVEVTLADVTKANTGVGGIVGRGNYGCNIINCSNSGNVIGNSTAVGGIIGNNNVSSTSAAFAIEACSNTGNITNNIPSFSSSTGAGGIIGTAAVKATTNNFTITGCNSIGNIVNKSSDNAMAGGIIGNNNTDTKDHTIIKACWTSINSFTGNGQGLIAGYSKNSTYTYCYGSSVLSGVSKMVVDASDTNTQTNCETFTTLAPSSAQISAMNTAWGSTVYKFDASGNIIPNN